MINATVYGRVRGNFGANRRMAGDVGFQADVQQRGSSAALKTARAGS
jgi:hypothetical protein